ncbi:peptidoglycan-binding protein [Scrofimicrobium sp. R131]|uniref:Peptidoglycan binding-like domain-containing protein n=1 Tax=Scrofimicrobium appendicitidis TaxID=3079930 RepID=A0AAU7V6X9_9ACTO
MSGAHEPSQPNEKALSTGRKKRIWLVVGAILVAVALILGTWVLAVRFQSPAQRQAAAEPPPMEPVVVELVRADLVERTTVMASAVRADSRSVALPAGTGLSVVTEAGVGAGGQVTAGDVVLWTNDRPLFALPGQFPFFRDIAQGDTGQDVLMLQKGLAAMGYGLYPDGDFGPRTAAALKDLYRSVGASAPMRDEDTKDAGQPAAADPASIRVQTGADPAQSGGEAPAPDPAPSTAPGPSGAPGANPSAPSSSGGGGDGSKPATQPKKVIYAPMSEFVVMDTLPAKVVSVPPVGTVLSGDNAKLELAGSQITLSAKFPGTVAVRLTNTLTGTADLGGKSVPVKISKITAPEEEQAGGDERASNRESSAESTVEFAPTQGALPADWAGSEEILISLDLTEPLLGVLQVPARAIAADASGGTSILVQMEDGTFEQVPVVQKTCLAGMCAIEDSPELHEGMRLRVDR